ncbi:ABC transporter permease [Methanobrevibacter boviskoreani]|uniref:ABC transporter permease n=1 Tax=Methanobrevibacter boviskoreani TaxID=1348249 RepID=UPI0023A8E233|nr:ABC transporter permease [Methanobrevibacter boviskoreani]MCI6774263.1 ABC transporter permease [Methanobrevibacter boviskoreani]MDY5613719.1 ABC transporter permease [Methanobrevibacter boviskoreani]
MLYKKLIRDLSDHKLQFMAVFLMVFLAVFIYVGVGSEAYGFDQEVQSYYNETNMANVWLYGDNFNSDSVDKVNNMSSVEGVERQLSLTAKGDMNYNPDVDLRFVENNSVAKYYPITGSKLNLSDGDGIWLDDKFAKAHNLGVGEDITLKFNGTKITKTIRGTGYSPEYVFEVPTKSIVPDYRTQGFAYLSHEAFPYDVQYNTMLIKTGENTSKFHNELDDVMDDYNTFLALENHGSHKTIISEIDQHMMMADMFPIIFIVVALLILLTTMARIITNQRTVIGTLKSLGFSNRKLVFHYLSYALLLTISGGVLGYILGPLLLSQLFYPSMSEFYSLPYWGPGFDVSFMEVPLVIIVLSVLFALMAIYSITSESPADALEPKAPKISKLRFISKTGLWQKLSFNLKWNIRDINRSKVRSLVTVVGIIGCTVLLICGFGMNDGMYELEHWQFTGINHYNSQIVLEDNATASQIDSIAERYNGTKVMSSTIEIKHNGIEKTTSLQSYSATGIITPNDQYENRMPYDNDSVIISIKAAQLLDVDVGDRIEWHIYGQDKWVNSTVTGISADPSTQGLVMTPHMLDDLGINFTPSTVVTYDSDIDENLAGISTVNHVDDLERSWDELTSVLYLIVGVLLVFSLVLAIIILYSLGMLSFIESERSFATLKVIGFKSKAIQKIFLTKDMFLSIIGFVIGVPLGLYVLRMMLDTAGENYFYPNTYSPLSIVYSFVIVIIVSLAVNFLLSRQIKRIDMVQSLKKSRE